jgi:hypothetical protein
VNTRKELAEALDQTGEDAARFRWMLVRPQSAQGIIEEAQADAGDSSREFERLVRERIDARRRR